MSVASDAAVVLDDRFSRELPEMAVRWQAETPPDPRLLVLNESLATELGLDAAWLRGPNGLRFLAGNLVPRSAVPVAQAYAGHQFGGLVPRLGDGRALLLPDRLPRQQQSMTRGRVVGRRHPCHRDGRGC